MLALSLLLVIGMAVVLGVTWSGALDGWSRGWSSGTLRRALGGVPAFVPVALFVLAVWWIVGRGLGWLDAHSGEIGAWFIVTFNWSDVRPLLQGAHYAGEWLRMVVAPFAGLVWLGDVLSRGWRPIVDRELLEACVLAHAAGAGDDRRRAASDRAALLRALLGAGESAADVD